MTERNAFPTADAERQPHIRRLLRKISFPRRSSSEPELNHLLNHSESKRGKLKRSMSTSAVITTGCLKVRTHDDSINRIYCSDGPEQRSVDFSTIEVRTYPIILGDNPSVSSGPPFTIDWDHQDAEEIDLSDYEILKPEKRTREQILLPASVRESWLRAQGYARSELVEVGKEVNRIKKCRNAIRPGQHQGGRLWKQNTKRSR
jgi:hypothetical protein